MRLPISDLIGSRSGISNGVSSASSRDLAPDSICFGTSQRQVTQYTLNKSVGNLARALQELNLKTVCIDLENSYEWCLIDLACMQADIVCVPVPQFFTPSQTAHLLQEVDAQLIFTPKPLATFVNDLTPTAITIGKDLNCDLEGVNIFLLKQQSTAMSKMPQNTQKITFTSGSTGTPKGVCLSVENQLKVAYSLADRINLSAPKHLVVLPLATLLENIAGVYAPLIAGGQVVIPSDQEKGFSGSKLVNPQAFLNCISEHQPDSMIVVPELLQLLVISSLHGWQAPASLKFIAVGGAKVAADLMSQARALGLPVFQGYGLSECASVVSLNTDINSPPDSVGEPLPHLKVTINNKQLAVTGNAFLGYLNQPSSWYPDTVETGDIAKLDNSLLYIQGRSKNLIINSFGRNISPEWIESELIATGSFTQVVVVGDSQPFLCALVYLMDKQATKEQLSTLLNKVNSGLPDYAQVHEIIVMREPLSIENAMLGETGKIKRDLVIANYQTQINHIYQQAAAQYYTCEKADREQENINAVL
jgi:long-chain acyl-CoA synthetase